MIKQLAWDTEFFKRKIGTIKLDDYSPASLAMDLETAKKDQYKYITCQLNLPEAKTVRLLESSGFYTSDIGVIWFMGIDDYFTVADERGGMSSASVGVAGIEDIPGLQEMIKPMFPNSRFYSDPYFTKDEADGLHVVWMENSVLGKAADVVLQVPGKGFVTCKRRDNDIGEIILIGVKDGCRGGKVGLALMDSSVKWFSDCGIKGVRVKTQLKNVDAMNFYRKLGFSIESYDMTFSYVV